MTITLQTVSGRSKLKPRRDPYWTRIYKGFYLGFRKMTATSEGVWMIRVLDETTKRQTYKKLGDFSHLPEYERFDAAQKEAIHWHAHVGNGGTTKPKTIADVCTNYVQNQLDKKGEKSAQDAKKRFASYVLNQDRFANLEIAKLTPQHIDTWRRALIARPTTSGGNRGARRSDSTLNRDITPFRAALNLACEEGWVTTDFAWRGKLKPLENADKKRDLYLDRDQRLRFIEKAEPALALFLRAMCMLPVRPGALASLKAGDFDQRLMQLSIGTDKTGQRKIKLPLSSATLFKESAKNKLPSAPLFSRSDGKPWNKDSWKDPVRAAATAAEMPTGTTAYTLRHSVITDLVHGGLDLLTVAQISGTSVRMIEQHYGHLRGDTASNALAALAL